MHMYQNSIDCISHFLSAFCLLLIGRWFSDLGKGDFKKENLCKPYPEFMIKKRIALFKGRSITSANHAIFVVLQSPDNRHLHVKTRASSFLLYHLINTPNIEVVIRC